MLTPYMQGLFLLYCRSVLTVQKMSSAHWIQGMPGLILKTSSRVHFWLTVNVRVQALVGIYDNSLSYLKRILTGWYVMAFVLLVAPVQLLSLVRCFLW